MTMQMMKTTARTGPMTHISPSSPSMIGCGSGLSSWITSEKGLAANVWKTRRVRKWDSGIRDSQGKSWKRSQGPCISLCSTRCCPGAGVGAKSGGALGYPIPTNSRAGPDPQLMQ